MCILLFYHSLYMIMVIHLLIDDTRKSLYDCIIRFLFDNTKEEFICTI